MESIVHTVRGKRLKSGSLLLERSVRYAVGSSSVVILARLHIQHHRAKELLNSDVIG